VEVAPEEVAEQVAIPQEIGVDRYARDLVYESNMPANTAFTALDYPWHP
jgi:hypothetical protein